MRLHTTKQQTAAELLLELLADGPMRPCEIRAEAERRGVDLDRPTWERAKRQLGVESHGCSRRWWWSLPDWSPQATADLLAGIERRLRLEVAFQEYLTERNRPRPGEQLTLT